MQLPDFLDQDKFGWVFLRGHRIGLNHVVDAYNELGSVDAVLKEFDTLSREQVEKTLAFWQDNRKEVDDYLARDRAELEAQAAAAGPAWPSLEELRRRMRERERQAAERAS